MSHESAGTLGPSSTGLIVRAGGCNSSSSTRAGGLNLIVATGWRGTV